MNNLINPQNLMSRSWQFDGDAKHFIARELRFLADNSIRGPENFSAKAWRLEKGELLLLDKGGTVLFLFNNILMLDGGLRLTGLEVRRQEGDVYLLEEPTKWRLRPGTKAALAAKIDRYGWKIGEHSYGVPSFIEEWQAKLSIGKYTSIAGGVKISFADHRTETVSTFPFSTLHDFWPSAPKKFPDHKTKGDISIGSDVWIGTDALINSGVTIGDGAVVGAKTIVTKNVPPYAVVVGSPGQIIRYRFPPEVIEQLLEIAWWDWPDMVVDAFLPLMMTLDISEFLLQAKQKMAIK